MRILFFNELSTGGLADYVHAQANALAERGLSVEVLCSPPYAEGRSDARYRITPDLLELRSGPVVGNRWRRRLRLATGLLENVRRLERHLQGERDLWVMTQFSEYLAPLWAWRLRRLRRRQGIRFCTVLHDPVRDYRIGPQWWHDRSVRAAYSFLSAVFVHTREPVDVPVPMRVVTVPHGIYAYPAPQRGRDAVRAELGIAPDRRMLLSFGYIRDNKNLDRVLDALTGFPELSLVVAGRAQGGDNRPLQAYQDQAQRLGIADRCVWLDRFISAEEAADLFQAADLSVMAYSRSFVSASGVLSVSANYRVPMLVSGGMRDTEADVRQYDLGIWVRPDDTDALRDGLRLWLRRGVSPDWKGFFRANSWARNAELVEAELKRPVREQSGGK